MAAALVAVDANADEMIKICTLLDRRSITVL